jgi:hypothetical protein
MLQLIINRVILIILVIFFETTYIRIALYLLLQTDSIMTSNKVLFLELNILQ